MQNMLLGTLNQGKVDEIRPLLANLPVRVITPLELGLRLEVPEEGATYAQNAIQKARAFAQASGMITLADDSGLEVAALWGSRPAFCPLCARANGQRMRIAAANC